MAAVGGHEETLARQWSCHLYYLDTATDSWVEHSSPPSSGALCLYTAPAKAKLVGFQHDGKVMIDCPLNAETVRCRAAAVADACGPQAFERMSAKFVAWNGPDRYYGASFETAAEQMAAVAQLEREAARAAPRVDAFDLIDTNRNEWSQQPRAAPTARLSASDRQIRAAEESVGRRGSIHSGSRQRPSGPVDLKAPPARPSPHVISVSQSAHQLSWDRAARERPLYSNARQSAGAIVQPLSHQPLSPVSASKSWMRGSPRQSPKQTMGPQACTGPMPHVAPHISPQAPASPSNWLLASLSERAEKHTHAEQDPANMWRREAMQLQEQLGSTQEQLVESRQKQAELERALELAKRHNAELAQFSGGAPGVLDFREVLRFKYWAMTQISQFADDSRSELRQCVQQIQSEIHKLQP